VNDTHILLIRHPETEANVTGRFVGRGDSPFTALGRRQRDRLPRKIRAFEPDVVWTSPLVRAAVVAERTARLTGVQLRIDQRLIELDFGDAEGLTYDQILARGMEFDYRSIDAPVAPGGESRGQIEGRAASFCDEISGSGLRHAVITHGGVYRASLVHLLGLSHTDVWAFHIHNAQLAHVRISHGHGMLESFIQG
jgi:alpha-ribazole phosphatase